MNSLMSEMQVLIPVNMDKEEVGHIFENYNLVSAGVVDKGNKLVGMITGDDVFTVLKEEAEEDVLRLAGVGNEEITDSILQKIWYTGMCFLKIYENNMLNGFDDIDYLINIKEQISIFAKNTPL